MKAQFRLQNPDEAEATLTITMTVKRWRELRDQLGDKAPSWQFAAAVTRLIDHASTHFDSEGEYVR